MFTLTIQLPHTERHLEIPADRTGRLLSDVLRGAGLELNTRCGQRGLCAGCQIELLAGELEHGSLGPVRPSAGEPLVLRGCEVSAPNSGDARSMCPCDRCWPIGRRWSHPFA